MLGLHLPVMKLCLGSAACVIENRLESEDSELERRLLGVPEFVRRDSPDGRPPFAPTRPSSAPEALPLGAGAPSASMAPRDDPLQAHTWHGLTAVSTANNEGEGAETLSRTSAGGASRRTSVLRPSRALEENGAAGSTGMVTPAKSVKFMLARKGSVRAGMVVQEDSGADSCTAARPGARGKTPGERAKDPRAAVLNVTVQARVWADYFNNTLRCWETLLDPFR